MPGIEAGQRFPFINLEKAIGRAKQLYDADHRGNEMSVAGAFAVWEYSEKSSGGHQTIAALRSYGLLSSAESGKIKLSKQALDYFRDEREDVRAELLQGFATTPQFLRSLWNIWGAHPPGDALARSHLKVDRGLSEQNARAVLGIYKDNLAYANLKGDAKLPEIDTGKGEQHSDDERRRVEVKVGDYIQWTSKGVDQFFPPRPVAWIAEDGSHLRVVGSMTGVPMDEVTPAQPTMLKPNAIEAIASTVNANLEHTTGPQPPEISVLLSPTGRLQISAEVDRAGLDTLREMLTKYDSILELLERPITSFKRPAGGG